RRCSVTLIASSLRALDAEIVLDRLWTVAGTSNPCPNQCFSQNPVISCLPTCIDKADDALHSRSQLSEIGNLIWKSFHETQSRGARERHGVKGADTRSITGRLAVMATPIFVIEASVRLIRRQAKPSHVCGQY